MSFDNCKVKIVDSIMGSGKTASVINMINGAGHNEKFIYVAPSHSEAKRIISCCKEKQFKFPKLQEDRVNLNDLKNLIRNRENIISTYALFQQFDKGSIDNCGAAGYTLILDEIPETIQEHHISSYDLENILYEYVDTKEDTKQLVWKDEYKNYVGEYREHKRLIDLGSLVYYGKGPVYQLFPTEVFHAFKEIYILTYRFNFRLQKHYCDHYNIPYTYMFVSGNSLDTYRLVDSNNSAIDKYNYANLINICNHEKLNQIGDTSDALSETWYSYIQDSVAIKRLKNNIYNYFFNITGDGSQYNMWTTFKDYERKMKGKGYTKGFLPLGSRGTDEYRDKTCIVYPVNIYPDHIVKNFFAVNGIKINEDEYALTEMLEFIWRSGIRDGKGINIYVPSIRMRKLLENWIEENSTLDSPTEQSKEE